MRGINITSRWICFPFSEEPTQQKAILKKLIAAELDVEESAIYGSDLYLYNRMEPSIWGAKKEFVSAPHLDDLQCAYASLQGFLKGDNSNNINVLVCYDNEEVGSGTKQGAGSTFMHDVLHRINTALGKNRRSILSRTYIQFYVECR